MSRFTGILLVLLALTPRLEGAMFLYLDGIPGETRLARHLNWVELLALQEGVSRPEGAARPTFSPLTIRKRIDSSSPPLMLACASGQPIGKAVLEAVHGNDESRRYLQIRLSDVLVSSFRQGGASETLPTEEFSLNFAQVSWTYTQIDARGRALRSITCSWDRAAGTGQGETPAPDGDNDGLPDDYERFYGLNPDIPDSDLDTDGDGLSNLDEFRAGTIPNAKDSVFRSTGTQLQPGKFALKWTRVPGKNYRLLAAPSPDGPFQFMQLVEASDSPDGLLEVATTPAHQFYLIEVE